MWTLSPRAADARGLSEQFPMRRAKEGDTRAASFIHGNDTWTAPFIHPSRRAVAAHRDMLGLHLRSTWRICDILDGIAMPTASGSHAHCHDSLRPTSVQPRRTPRHPRGPTHRARVGGPPQADRALDPSCHDLCSHSRSSDCGLRPRQAQPALTDPCQRNLSKRPPMPALLPESRQEPQPIASSFAAGCQAA